VPLEVDWVPWVLGKVPHHPRWAHPRSPYRCGHGWNRSSWRFSSTPCQSDTCSWPFRIKSFSQYSFVCPSWMTESFGLSFVGRSKRFIVYIWWASATSPNHAHYKHIHYLLTSYLAQPILVLQPVSPLDRVVPSWANKATWKLVSKKNHSLPRKEKNFLWDLKILEIHPYLPQYLCVNRNFLMQYLGN
jgi:hypothetical protein